MVADKALARARTRGRDRWHTGVASRLVRRCSHGEHGTVRRARWGAGKAGRRRNQFRLGLLRQSDPALDQMLAAAHRREFDTVLVWAADRLARSVRHFLEVLDTLNHLSIEFVSFRENLDTGGPLDRAVIVISAVEELERNLIIERVRAGLRRAKLEGRVLGRKPIDIDRMGLLRDRARGLSLAQLAKAYKISRTSVARALKQSGGTTPKSTISLPSTNTEYFAKARTSSTLKMIG